MIRLAPIQITLTYTTKSLHINVSDLITSELKIKFTPNSSKKSLKS